MGQLPLGLPERLPPATVVVATTRPGIRLPAGLRVERIDVESQLNRDDLLAYLDRITTGDPRLAEALAGMDRDRFCRALLERSGGVWIYALSVLDQIRDQQHSPAEVDTLPAGLAGYYANNITRWQSDPTLDWDEVALPVLGTLAAARAPQPATTPAAWAGVSLREVKRLLRGAFKAFLVLRAGGDPHTYALRHQSLRDLLEGRLPAGTGDRLREMAYDLAEATRAAHARIVTALVPNGEITSRDWCGVGNYARAHLAEHAARCGQLDELVGDPEFILVSSGAELLRLRRHLRTAAGTAAVGALELASNSWNKSHKDRLHWLEVSARKLGCGLLADTVAMRLDSRWHCRAALWSGSSHRILTGHTGEVRALVAVPLADGGTLLASGGDDDTVRLWDPLTGTPRGKLTGHTGGVRALVAVPLADGSTLLASGGHDRAVIIWEPHAVDQGGSSCGAGIAVGGLDAADCHALDGDQPCAAGRVVAGADQVAPIVGGPHAASADGRAW